MTWRHGDKQLEVELMDNSLGFSRLCSTAWGTIKYDCSRWGRIEILAYLGKISLNTGSGGKLEIRSVDFELVIEKGMLRADGTLINWGDPETKKADMGALPGAMRGYVDAPSADHHNRHALAVPAADNEKYSNDDQSMVDAGGSTGSGLLGGGSAWNYDRCEATHGKEFIFLDRKRFYCPSGKIMRAWDTSTAGCHHGKQSGKTYCTGTDRESADVRCGAKSNHKTTYQNFGNELVYLDRFTVRSYISWTQVDPTHGFSAHGALNYNKWSEPAFNLRIRFEPCAPLQ